MATHTTRDGTRLFYRIRGKGAPTIVFVHGWCSRESHWDAQMRHFGRQHRVLAIDRRGHGRSDAPATGYTARQHAADLREILRKERVQNAVVVGHAGGVPATLELTRADPGRIRALVLIDSRVHPKADLDDPSDPAGVAFRGMVDAIRGKNGAREFKRMYSDLFSPHAGATGRQAIREALETPREIAADELSSITIDTLSLAKRIRQPVLWLTAGAEDEAAISNAFRDVQFGQAVGSGHFPQLEVPDQINAMISRFIATLSSQKKTRTRT
jgi:pimeloyl-ACP methyl ester carboxylesterase